jgi:adenylate cyclase
VYGYIGDVYIAAKDYSNALQYLNEAKKIAEETGDKAGSAEKLQAIGSAYLAIATDSINTKESRKITGSKQDALVKSIAYFFRAADIHKQIGNIKDLSENYRDLSTSYELTGDYKEALENHKQYMASKDSVFSQQNKEKLKKLEIKRDIDLKDKQIQIDKLEVAKKRSERIFYIAGIILLLLVIVFISRNYRLQKRSNILLSKANLGLEEEKKRSEDLLLNILPSEVANELKSTGSAQAKQFDDVTVLFTDFVNFSRASEKMSPQELVNELDICFKAFDRIIGKYNVEKIKTIGDAYLAVSGLPLPDALHAENAVNVAIEINNFIETRKVQLGDKAFDVRIGIHSGSLVAGIVGLKKFAYDIWGDTVNVAARMEQNSEPGKINISQNTYELLKGKFNCTYRGEIEAKNKGKLGMYFVEGIIA